MKIPFFSKRKKNKHTLDMRLIYHDPNGIRSKFTQFKFSHQITDEIIEQCVRANEIENFRWGTPRTLSISKNSQYTQIHESFEDENPQTKRITMIRIEFPIQGPTQEAQLILERADFLSCVKPQNKSFCNPDATRLWYTNIQLTDHESFKRTVAERIEKVKIAIEEANKEIDEKNSKLEDQIREIALNVKEALLEEEKVLQEVEELIDEINKKEHVNRVAKAIHYLNTTYDKLDSLK